MPGDVSSGLLRRTPTPSVVETRLGPGLPALRIGQGPRTLAFLPGLTIHEGPPAGHERRRAIGGWEPLLDRYTIHWLGRRVGPPDVTFADMALDAAEALAALDPPVDIVAESTGGAIAIHLAAARPDLVRRLVLVTTAHRLSEEAQAIVRRAVRAAGREDWRRAFAEMMTIAAPWRPVTPFASAFGWLAGPRIVGIPADPRQALAELAAWQRVDAVDLLPSIASPTLVVGAQRDRVFPEPLVRTMAAAIPDARVVTVPHQAHWFPRGVMRRFIAPFLG